MKKLRLILPYPPSELLPNKHTHWSVKAKATREARKTAYWMILEQRGIGKDKPMDSVALDITFYPAIGRGLDYDNMLTCCKPYLDSMTDAKIIKDDSSKVIKLVSLRVGEKSDEPRTEIIVEEV